MCDTPFLAGVPVLGSVGHPRRASNTSQSLLYDTPGWEVTIKRCETIICVTLIGVTSRCEVATKHRVTGWSGGSLYARVCGLRACCDFYLVCPPILTGGCTQKLDSRVTEEAT